MINITVATQDGRAAQIAVAGDESVENVKALVEVELGVMLLRQQLSFNGRVLANHNTLGGAGVKDGDLLLVTEIQATATPASAPAPAAAASASTSAPVSAPASAPASAASPALASAATATATATALPLDAIAALNSLHLPRIAIPTVSPDEPVPTGLSLEDLPSNLLPDRLHAIVRANPRIMRELEGVNPAIAEACKDANPARLREVLMMRTMRNYEAGRQAAEEAQRLNDNPFDPEAQARIAEAIRRENVDSNYRLAMEHVPEAFSRVVMLYVDCEVNGTPLKAFVDSGAQDTIMSVKCAERCGIMRLVDTRFAGQAVGVGTAKIVGKVHLAQLKIGGVFLNCSFTVLEQNDMDFLFGLNMLKRHQCVIDLRNNRLQLEGPAGPIKVPFLSEAEVRGHTDARFINQRPGSGLSSPVRPPQPPNAAGAGAGAGAAAPGTGAGSAPPAPPSVPPAPSGSGSGSAGGGGGAGSTAPAAGGGGAGGLFSLPDSLFDPAALAGSLAAEADTGAGAGSGGGAPSGAVDPDSDAAMPSAAAAAPTSAAAPAPAAASAPVTAPTAAANAAREAQIGRLVALGNFSRTAAENALDAMGGNEQMAALLLLQDPTARG